jgi:hypothetical protein
MEANASIICGLLLVRATSNTLRSTLRFGNLDSRGRRTVFRV